MTKSQRKRLVKASGLSPTILANELGLNRSTVLRVIDGAAKSRRVATHVALRCGQTLAAMFPIYAAEDAA